jgi:BirA family biotin operon repressor/biotin-[acetyl-CoA-carboxylase] ligase
MRETSRQQPDPRDDVIIHYLMDAPGYVSGEEMAQQLRISRTAVWQHVNSLKALGFVIESQPHLGYKLVHVPDKMLPALIEKGLDTACIGKRIAYLERTTSTSDEAEKFARHGEPEGTVVVAEDQTAGRGRVGRAWRSTRGKGIYLSIILRPALPPARIAFLTLCSAVAAAEAINRCCDLKAFVKWPNDVILSGKKISGILTELSTEADRINFAVVGVGINVNQERGDLRGLPGASSLKIESGREFSRLDLTRAFLESFDRAYGLLLGERYREIIERWLRVSKTVGRRIRVESFAGGRCEGVATGLDDDGCLLLRLDNGMTKRITGGDVSII